ncbi:hypothetical protein AAE478_004724 [Parahypoxylon ruwenzoriense]
MLGWALKRGFQSATGRNDASRAAGEDTTQFEAPDTPAPIFAARAIKNAIFGAPNAQPVPLPAMQKNAGPGPGPAKNANDDATLNDMKSPNKPTSILLTPGTATARRKRVSFNHDVKTSNSAESSPLARSRSRKKTTLQQALENSRSERSKKSAEKVEEDALPKAAEDESEGEWEDDNCNHDLTVDLNEPHSESGKYWKAEFNRYRDEAMADIERMVKFKALAKSYAKQKDAEALELAQKLKEEQAKVAEMEEKVATMAAQFTDKRRRGSNSDDAAPLIKDLAKQTALASQYRDQVKELEALLREYQGESCPSPSDRRIDTSPRTERTILEVNRELRRARSELKHMDKLREEVKRLKFDLNAAQQRATILAERHGNEGTFDSRRVQKLEKQLRDAKDELRQKDADIRKLKRDYETLKRDAKLRTSEAMQVLQGKNDKIAELERTIKALEASNTLSRATQDLKSSIESLGKPSIYEGAKLTRRPRRAASVEDLTLDMTRRSLLGDEDEPKTDGAPRETKPDAFSAPDWSTNLLNIGRQLKKKKERVEANRREKDLVMEDFYISPPRPITKARAPSLSSDSRKAMTNVLSSRLNETSAKDAAARHRLSAQEPLSSDVQRGVSGQRVTRTRPMPSAEDEVELHGALEKPTPQTRPKSLGSRPVSSGGESPGFDLVQNKFARLGGPEPERTGTVNTSRCTLPADRQAAARARLEQKRLERQKNGGRLRDKENVRP